MATATKPKPAVSTLLPSSSADQVFFRPAGMPEQLTVGCDDVATGRYQPRTQFDEASLQELADSIKAHGILTRLKVFINEHGHYELIAGERRLRAAKLAGLDRVPVEVCEYTLRQIHEISILDNLQRADLTPQEEGASFERLISELGISEAELSRRLGKNRGYIQQRRALATAPAALQQAFAAGKVTLSHIRGILAGAPDRPDDQTAALDAALRMLEYKKVTEEECRQIAEEKVAGSIMKDVEWLGWKVRRPSGASGKPLLFSATHRPRPTSIPELLAILTKQERPDPATAEEVGEELTREEQQVLFRCDRRFDTYTCPPWLKPDGSKGSKAWITPAEVRATVIVECQGLIDDITARIAALGYRLQPGGTYYWEIWQGDRQTHKYLSWDSLNREVAKLEATPPVDAAVAPAMPVPAATPFQPTQIGGQAAQPGARLIDIFAGTELRLPEVYKCDVDELCLEICEAFESDTGGFQVKYPLVADLLQHLLEINGGQRGAPTEVDLATI
jgi:ParB/RepB/Spo0J family partition protein